MRMCMVHFGGGTPPQGEGGASFMAIILDWKKLHAPLQIFVRRIDTISLALDLGYGALMDGASWSIRPPKIDDKDSFELKGQFLKELRDNTFSGSDHEDSNKHIEKVLEIVDLFHIPNITQDQVMLRAFPMSLTRVASRWLRNKPSSSITAWEDLKIKQILNSKGAIPSKTAADAKDGLAAIQAQLNNLGREIKKVNEKVYAAQLGCEQCKGPHYTKDCPLKEEGKTLKEAYYTQFGGPYQGGGYRAAAPRFYQRNNNTLRTKARGNIKEETLSKNRRLMFKSRQSTIPFLSRLNDYYREEKKGSYGPQFSEAYSYGALYTDNSYPKGRRP
ncbi:hypothetical protein Tco_0793506 [Tanacetum coccineum]